MALFRARVVLRLALLVIVTYLAICAFAGAWLGGAALHTPRRSVDASATAVARALAGRQDARMEAVTIAAADDAVLHAWVFTPGARHGNGDAVLLLHGVSDTRVGMLGIAEMLLANGYTVLAADARAHGESGGSIATYGVLERDDARRWSAWLHARQEVRGCVHGVGVSMGAAQLIQALDEPGAFCSAVAESPFASFREVAFDRLGQRTSLPTQASRLLLHPLVDLGLVITRLRYGVDLDTASPQAALQATRTPVLLIQGDRDTNIPPRHARLLKAANPDAVTVWMVGSDQHAMLSAVNADAYRERVLLFLTANDGRQATGL